MIDKVVLIHGPVVSPGLNDVTRLLLKSNSDAKIYREQFNASATIKSNAISYKALGYKIIFSGWEEDKSWVQDNSNLFDGYTIQSPIEPQTETNLFGETIENNKEKLYRSCLAGYELIDKLYKKTSSVFRMRSDITVNPNDTELEIIKLQKNPNSILVEYANPAKPYWVPDFMLLSNCGIGLSIYSQLNELCNAGASYHISSHIDHSIMLLKLIELNEISKIICMNASLQTGLIWRGIPRYLVEVVNGKGPELFFNCELNYPLNKTSDQVINEIPAEFSGKRKP